MANVLITGGSGLLGQHISTQLINNNYTVGYLTRSPFKSSVGIKSFLWDVDHGNIDPEAIPWADHIIHLAGETVGQRWSPSVREKILHSRVNSTKLLIKYLAQQNHYLKSFISASAIGFYGDDTGDEVHTEGSPKGNGFLADVVEAWEAAIDEAAQFANQVVKLRIGVVLAKEGGALPKMATPVKWGVGSVLGSGKQWMSWIHINDLSKMFLFAVEQPLQGVFNAVGPNPVNNKYFTQLIAKHLKRPLILPPTPKFVLNTLLGKMSVLAIGGNKTLPKAMQEAGFKFEFNTAEEALSSLL